MTKIHECLPEIRAMVNENENIKEKIFSEMEML